MSAPHHVVPNRFLKNAHPQRYPAASPSWRRGNISLLIRRDATLRISGVPVDGISQGYTCIWVFLSTLGKDFFSKLLVASV
jgi:hypothetical protein